MTVKNRYKFTFGEKTLTLTTDKDNLYMEEVERIAKEKYKALKERLPKADDETLAILLAINTLSVQLGREMEYEKLKEELLAQAAKPTAAKAASSQSSLNTSLFDDLDEGDA